MCGIVGFVGREEAAPILLDGLSRLEYRGYDSAGIAVYGRREGLQVVKAKGRLQVLQDLVQGGRTVHGTLGLGHTRWATHGEPSDVNSHPQVSESGRFAVVHNGIIENYMELREFLQSEGITFVSQTDTEVVAQLLEHYYDGDILDAVVKTLNRIQGAYALGIVCADCPDRLIAARKDSPLILGYGEGAHYLASDVTALIKYTREVCYLDDGEIAELTADHLWVYDAYLRPVEKERCHVDWEISAAEKGGYEHFMAKEIMEQPQAVSSTVRPRVQEGAVRFEELGLTEDRLRKAKYIHIIGCGSALHAGMVGKHVIESMCRIRCSATVASEFRYENPIISPDDLCIVISQSGETADTLAAMRLAKEAGAFTLAIVNVVSSTIAREADGVLYTWAGPEISVATTKAYSAQLSALYLIAANLARICGTIDAQEEAHICDELFALSDRIRETLQCKEQMQYEASLYANRTHVFFLGRGLDYAAALEASLKLKEISYIHSEAYAAGELKHGTISLIEEGTLVVALATQPALYEKTVSNIREVVARGAAVILVTTEDFDGDASQCQQVIRLPKCQSMFSASLSIVPLQLLAYYVSVQLGLDVDKPRNLAKSVTVE